MTVESLITHGKNLFEAVWTGQEGGGHPLTKGTGDPLSNPSTPLVFPRNFNRITSPEANSRPGCHARPRSGGRGDMVANAFLPAQRYDFVTFNSVDPLATKGARDENGTLVTLQSIGNERLATGMFGSGFIEMLSRQMPAERQAICDTTPPGGSNLLVSKGIAFGAIAHNAAGNLQPGDAPVLSTDLSSDKLPQPRLKPDKNGVIHVPAFTDLKLHDITDPAENSNVEPLDMQHDPKTSPAAFFTGNRKFLTKKLWGAANESPFFHNGKYTTLREATLAHSGEALNFRAAFQALPPAERDAVIEFLKSLRTLPDGTRFLVTDERGEPRPNLP